MPKRLTVAVTAAVVLAVGGTAVAQSVQRFSDVPPEHEAHEAIEWAAEVGLTLGYEDGTFRPDEPLPRWAALVFMERFYDQILQAEEPEGFTRGDMMLLLKAIDDGTTTPDPDPDEPEGRWLPRDDDRIADGRCAHTLSDDPDEIYEWEDCAWGDRLDPVRTRAEMEALTARVWAETRARGKPDSPPALVEGQCPRKLFQRVAACYSPGAHTISIESGVTLRVILHELAHALISGDDVLAACYADWAAAVPTCAHGPLFRCAADALYRRYADIDAAGVCGAVPDTGAWIRLGGETFDGRWSEWRTTVARGDAIAGGEVRLAIRCAQGTRTVYVNGSLAYFQPQIANHVGQGTVEYRFGGGSEVVRVAAIDLSNEYVGGYGDWWVLPGAEADRLLAGIAADTSNRLFVRLVSEEQLEAEAVLRTTGWAEHMGRCD